MPLLLRTGRGVLQCRYARSCPRCQADAFILLTAESCQVLDLGAQPNSRYGASSARTRRNAQRKSNSRRRDFSEEVREICQHFRQADDCIRRGGRCFIQNARGPSFIAPDSAGSLTLDVCEPKDGALLGNQRS